MMCSCSSPSICQPSSEKPFAFGCRQFCLLLKEDCWCHGLSREWKRNLSPSFDDNNEKQISRRFNLEYDAQRRYKFFNLILLRSSLDNTWCQQNDIMVLILLANKNRNGTNTQRQQWNVCKKGLKKREMRGGDIINKILN